MKKHRRLGLLTLIACAVGVGCSDSSGGGGGAGGVAPNQEELSAFVLDLIQNETDDTSDPVETNASDFGLDADATAFDTLFQ